MLKWKQLLQWDVNARTRSGDINSGLSQPKTKQKNKRRWWWCPSTTYLKRMVRKPKSMLTHLAASKKKKEKRIRESSRTQDSYATHSSDPNPAPKGKKTKKERFARQLQKSSPRSCCCCSSDFFWLTYPKLCSHFQTRGK